MGHSSSVLEEAQAEVTQYVRQNPNVTVDDISEALGMTVALTGQALRQAVLYEDLVWEMKKNRKYYTCGGRIKMQALLTRRWA